MDVYCPCVCLVVFGFMPLWRDPENVSFSCILFRGVLFCWSCLISVSVCPNGGCVVRFGCARVSVWLAVCVLVVFDLAAVLFDVWAAIGKLYEINHPCPPVADTVPHHGEKANSSLPCRQCLASEGNARELQSLLPKANGSKGIRHFLLNRNIQTTTMINSVVPLICIDRRRDRSRRRPSWQRLPLRRMASDRFRCWSVG